MNNTSANTESGDNLPQRLRQVLTATTEELFLIIQESSPELLLTAMRNPLCGENHIIAMLKRRGLPQEIFRMIYSGPERISSHKVRLALVCHPETPSHIALALIPQLLVFDLVKICFFPGITPDHRIAAERAIIQRLPSQPLGNKLTLARRGTSLVAEALLKECVPQITEACLDNPRLKESSVLQFAASSSSTPEAISMVARHPRWKDRKNVRLAMLKNPRTPNIWFTLFLPSIPRHLLKELHANRRLTSAQRELVKNAMNGVHA